MKRYVLARATINPFMTKLATMLKSRGARVESLSIYEPTDDKKKVFHKCHYLMKREEKLKQKSKIGMIKTYFSILKQLKTVTKPLKDCHMVIGVSEPNAFVYFVFLFSKCKKIFYPYDISKLRYKKFWHNKWYDWFFEKKNFKKADAIIHKVPEKTIESLSLNKPVLQFLPYADFENIQKDFNKLEGTHIVYVGSVYDGKNKKGTFPLKHIFAEIVHKNIHMHVYPTNYPEVSKDKDIINLQDTEYFHLHKPVYGEQLRKELSQYHWGLYMLYFDQDIFKKDWADSVFGNKVADYVEAGLPILTNKGLPFVCEIIEKYHLGLCINHYSNIEEEIKKCNYSNIQKNTSIGRHRFTMDKHNHKLIDFLEKIENE